VDRLRASGAITGFSVTVDPGMLGWTTEAYVELFCRGRTSPSDIAAAVSKYPEVTGAATITGEADALLHIRAADVRHFEEVVEHISAEPFRRTALRGSRGAHQRGAVRGPDQERDRALAVGEQSRVRPGRLATARRRGGSKQLTLADCPLLTCRLPLGSGHART
jgi:DNA-binding Lrp family transcriptional regulator